MKTLIIAAVLFFGLVTAANALQICWDQSTTDASGAPLGSGLAATQYQLWRCNTPSAGCLRADAQLLASVNAPFPAVPAQVCASITGEAIPATYFAVAVNIATVSSESDSLKVTGADKPRNVGAQP